MAGLEHVRLECIVCNSPPSTHVLSVWILSFNKMNQHKFRRLVFFLTIPPTDFCFLIFSKMFAVNLNLLVFFYVATKAYFNL